METATAGTSATLPVGFAASGATTGRLVPVPLHRSTRLPDSGPMETVGFEHMVDGTPEDYELIGRELVAHKAAHLTDHLLPP